MKKLTLIATALICAQLLTAGIASAQGPPPPYQPVSAQQSPTPPFPVVRTPVAGYSPNLAAPQPATKAILARDANRLIRWEGWLDIDAFSVSVLNQMQIQLGNAIEVGSYTIAEPEIAEAVMNAKARNSTFEMNPNLNEDAGQNFESIPTLYVWTYRHNFADQGLYQLYVSAKGKMDIGTQTVWKPKYTPGTPGPLHQDIQSLHYEFGDNEGGTPGSSIKMPVTETVFADVEIWRGAVVFVNSRGELEVAGNEGGVHALEMHQPVEEAPMSLWERAPSLISNPNYDPRRATGAAFVEPLERAISIPRNVVQQRAGNVQSRVRTVTPFRYRVR
jgi:hypothetical protein